MNALVEMKCVPCRGDSPTVTAQELIEWKPAVPDWQIVDRDGVQHLERIYKFKNFVQALAFTNQVGAIAEEEGHHPMLITEWGRVSVSWWTHAIGGLHRNDFIMAARTDAQYQST